MRLLELAIFVVMCRFFTTVRCDNKLWASHVQRTAAEKEIVPTETNVLAGFQELTTARGPQSTGLEKIEEDNSTEDYLSEEEKNVINCQCGFKRSGLGKIVGGTLADDHAWPWMAALVFVGDMVPRQFCGGSLINTQYILTAGHCVQDMAAVGLNKFRVYLGTNQIVNSTSLFLQSTISFIRIHPNYNKKTLNSDIALIKLTSPINFSENILPVCLGQKGAPHIGRVATVAGWGSLSASTSPVNSLRNVNVKVIPNPECAADYLKVKIRITNVMLCAALPKKDSCKGDSGGPLFAKRSNSANYDQIGIVSFGQDCAKPDFPGVYARVGRFIKWIKENTQDADYCSSAFSKP